MKPKTMKRRTMKRRAIAIGAAALMTSASSVLVGTGRAGADPPETELLRLSCDELGTVDVDISGRSLWSSGRVVRSNRVLVPYELLFEGTFTPTQGEPQNFTEHHIKPAPRHGRTDHCTFHQEGTDPEGTFEVDGQVWLSYTPSR